MGSKVPIHSLLLLIVFGKTKISKRTKPGPILGEWAFQILEYKYLTELTGSEKYMKRIKKIEAALEKLELLGVDLDTFATVNEGNHLMAKGE